METRDGWYWERKRCDRRIKDLRDKIMECHKGIERLMEERRKYEGDEDGNNTLD